MIKKYALLVFMVCANTATAADSLCKSSEEELFGCTAKEKIISLCLPYPEKGGLREITYKFGALKKVELEFPLVKEKSNSVFFLSSRPLAGGIEARVHFSNAKYDYIIYDVETTYGYSGLLVRKDNKNIAQIRCDNDATLKAPAYELLPREEFAGDIVIAE